MQFTCVACSLLVKTGIYSSFYVASTSRRIHAIARNKAHKLRVTSPAGCRLTYLQFAVEFTCGVMADCLQLQVIMCTIASIFACDCADIFACVCSYFFLGLAGILPPILKFLPANCMYFCLQKQAILHEFRM